MDKHFASAIEGATNAEVDTLASILGVKLPRSSSGFLRAEQREQLWNELSYLGSNDIAYALRGFEGVEYAEIVRDVCELKDVKGISEHGTINAVIKNEKALLRTIFEDAWEQMSADERALLLTSLGVNGSELTVSSAATAVGIFVGEMGGFGTYKVALSVANWVARAILGRGLSLVGNALLTRAMGVILGPVGWIASGGWLLVDALSPAKRKTLPAVIQVAALRELTRQREVIGVMGHGATGKDSLLKNLFDIDTNEIDPIPGSTSAVKTFDVKKCETPVRVVNFPGFGDLRERVVKEVHEQAAACTTIIYLFNGAEVPKADELEEWARYSKAGNRSRPVEVIPVLNKWDKADDDERARILAETKKRIGRDDVIVASMKKGKPYFEDGLLQLKRRLNELALAREHGAPFPEEQSTQTHVR